MKLKQLEFKKKMKTKEMDKLKGEFARKEKLMNTKEAKQIQKYKPSLWQSMKTTFSRVANNFKNWIISTKQEKQEVKQAKEAAVRKAKLKTRTNATVESEKRKKNKMKNIREEMNFNIPLEEQRDYSIKKQKEFEKEAKENPEKDVIYLDMD